MIDKIILTGKLLTVGVSIFNIYFTYSIGIYILTVFSFALSAYLSNLLYRDFMEYKSKLILPKDIIDHLID